MVKPVSKNFSVDVQDCNSVDEQLKLVGHPLVKQVLTQVLREDSSDGSSGSAFGEGGPPV